MRHIPLTGGLEAIVDDELAEYLGQWKWQLRRGRLGRGERTNYAIRNTGRPSVTIYMHRLITRAPRGLPVDHINHNGLDNRVSNLRVVTSAENGWNRRPEAKGKGVSWSKREGSWRAFIDHFGTKIHIGYYADKEIAIAARAYAEAILRGGKSTKPFDQLLLAPALRAYLHRGVSS